MIVRVGSRLNRINLVKLRNWTRDKWQTRWQCARLRLIEIACRQELRSLRAYIADFEYAVTTQLLLHVQVPVLHVRRAQVALNRLCRIRQREGKERWERIA